MLLWYCNYDTGGSVSVTVLILSLLQDILLGKPLQRAYADTHLPTNQLGNFIRLCLTDSNFPSFVEAVEKELNDI